MSIELQLKDYQVYLFYILKEKNLIISKKCIILKNNGKIFSVFLTNIQLFIFRIGIYKKGDYHEEIEN